MLQGEEEMVDLVEVEVRELLSSYDFDGDNTPIVRGSAKGALEGKPEWEAKILELMDAVDTYIDSPVRELDKPFLMAVEDVFTITGRGTVATGKVERGQVKLNEEVEIVGYKAEPKNSCYRYWNVQQNLQSAMAGDNAEFF